MSHIIPEPTLEPTITETPPPETTTITETPPVIISEATSTANHSPTTTTQSLPEVAVVPPSNVRPTRISKSTKKG